jgi:hypothetical protein
MDPALARRVAASLGRGRSGGARATPRLVAGLRLLALLAICAVLTVSLVARSRARSQVEHVRDELARTLKRERALLPREGLDTVGRVETWLSRLSGPYEGDLVGSEVRGRGALDRVLSPPTVYVRGGLAEFGTKEAIERTAAASTKDAFLLCLIDPPLSREERALLGQVRLAYSGGKPFQERTGNVARFHAAQVGRALLSPESERRIVRAETLRELEQISRDYMAAPFSEARLAHSARLLLAVIDEPGVSTGLSEMDGERPHDVRVALVDLAVKDVLLRVRRRVDPSFIAPARRARYAMGLDSCALALDVREAARE